MARARFEEDHPERYRREAVRLVRQDGVQVEAITYRAPAAADFVRPTQEYLRLCREGRETFGLDPHAVDVAARRTSRGALFVYGQLMRGEPLWPEVENLGINCCLLARARGALVDHGAYPGFVATDVHGDQCVEGEYVVFDDIDAALAVLDGIEEFHGAGDPRNRFERMETIVDVGGRARSCQVYASLALGAQRIESGDWRAHRGRRAEIIRAIADAHIRL